MYRHVGEMPPPDARQSPALKRTSLLLCSSLLPQLEYIRLKRLGAAKLEPDALQLGGAACCLDAVGGSTFACTAQHSSDLRQTGGACSLI